jgi:uncharacterized protein YacL
MNTASTETITTIAVQLLLAAMILLVVYRIVVAGIKIANAKEEADKRKEGFKSIANAGIGLVIVLSSYGFSAAILRYLATEIPNINKSNMSIIATFLAISVIISVISAISYIQLKIQRDLVENIQKQNKDIFSTLNNNGDNAKKNKGNGNA